MLWKNSRTVSGYEEGCVWGARKFKRGVSSFELTPLFLWVGIRRRVLGGRPSGHRAIMSPTGNDRAGRSFGVSLYKVLGCRLVGHGL